MSTHYLATLVLVFTLAGFGESAYSAGSESTILTVSTLTRTTWPTRRTMYSSSSGLLGSLVMPLVAAATRCSLIWYWSITQSRAERLPRR